MIGTVIASSTSLAAITVALTNPWPPEPQVITVTAVARSGTQLTEVAVATVELVEVAAAKTRLTQ
jgi:hypothetical protein